MFLLGAVVGIIRLYENIISYWNVALDGARNCLLMLSCSWESYKTFVVITWLQSPWCGTFIKVTEGIKALCLWYQIELPRFLQNNELTETITNVYLNMVIAFFTLQITMCLFLVNKKLKNTLKIQKMAYLSRFFFNFLWRLKLRMQFIASYLTIDEKLLRLHTHITARYLQTPK